MKKQLNKNYDFGGQIWEDCERCGKEPVYLRFYLCEPCSISLIENGNDQIDEFAIWNAMQRNQEKDHSD